MSNTTPRKPAWLKVLAPGGDNYVRLKSTLRELQLHTVCEEAHCPNVGECWREGTATVIVLGDVCTRGCRFCAVASGNPRGVIDPQEPRRVAEAVIALKLRYVVLTMVNRDDLEDGGAALIAETIRRLKESNSTILVEALVGDFRGKHEDLETVLAARPDVFAHNVEVVRRLTRTVRDARCTYDQSLAVLEEAKAIAPERLTKSSLMVGVGETDEEVDEALRDLRSAQVDIVTLGQYLRPTPRHLPVDRYVEPDKFSAWAQRCKELGFKFVASGPLVRSSYKAAEVFVRAAVGQSSS